MRFCTPQTDLKKKFGFIGIVNPLGVYHPQQQRSSFRGKCFLTRLIQDIERMKAITSPMIDQAKRFSITYNLYREQKLMYYLGPLRRARPCVSSQQRVAAHPVGRHVQVQAGNALQQLFVPKEVIQDMKDGRLIMIDTCSPRLRVGCTARK